MTLIEDLRHRLPNKSYLIEWFGHRENLEPWPTSEQDRWVGLTGKAIVTWTNERDKRLSVLDRQEAAKMTALVNNLLPLAEATSFVNAIYPEASQYWTPSLEDNPIQRKALAKSWKGWRSLRQSLYRNRADAADLPNFHQNLWKRIRKLVDAETTVSSLLTNRDLGWDLDEGIWEELDFSSLKATAALLEKEPALKKIAELLGRDYRSKSNSPPPPSPLPPSRNNDPEPGRTEIKGVRFGDEWAALVSSEASLLAFKETQTLFFKKAAEVELLIWDHFSPAIQEKKNLQRTLERQKRNERGPIVIALDTSGSMRGKPEEVAKSIVLAILRVALEEERACYLINFSVQTRCIDLSELGSSLPELLRFLNHSFHGGTDLAPALRECVRVLEKGTFREADVLVISDFAVPKIPTAILREVRNQQELNDTRFYSLTVSVRPLYDFLNIFDAGWVYNIHPFQTNGITSQSLELL